MLNLVIKKVTVIGDKKFSPGDTLSVPLDPTQFRRLYEARRVGIEWIPDTAAKKAPAKKRAPAKKTTAKK